MKKVRLKEDYLETSDIALGATLSCFGYRIDEINKSNPFKAVFLIRKDEKLDALVKAYFVHELKVEPMDFFNSLKELKTRIYNGI